MGAMDLNPEKKPTRGNLVRRELEKETCPLPLLPPTYLRPAPHWRHTTRRQMTQEPADAIHTARSSWAHEMVGKGQAGNLQHHSSNNTENCRLVASRDNRIFHVFNPKPQAVDFNIETRMVISATNKARKIISIYMI